MQQQSNFVKLFHFFLIFPHQMQSVHSATIRLIARHDYPFAKLNTNVWFGCQLSEPVLVTTLMWYVPHFSNKPGKHCHYSIFANCTERPYGCPECFHSPGNEMSTENTLYGRITIQCQPAGVNVTSCNMSIHSFQLQDSGYYGCYLPPERDDLKYEGISLHLFPRHIFPKKDCSMCGIRDLTYSTCLLTSEYQTFGTVYRCICIAPYWGYLCRYKNDTVAYSSSSVTPSTPLTRYPIANPEPPYYIMEPETTILVGCLTMFVFGLLGPTLSWIEHCRNITDTVDEDDEDDDDDDDDEND